MVKKSINTTQMYKRPKYNRPPRLRGLKQFKSSAENETKKNKREGSAATKNPASFPYTARAAEKLCLKQAGMKKSFRAKMYNYYRGT